VAETILAGTGRGLTANAAAAGFAVELMVVEVEGLCPACRDATAP
jgi:Fe2+ or Zn2+ uptake regulation protein